jgi:hypothetical protein
MGIPVARRNCSGKNASGGQGLLPLDPFILVVRLPGAGVVLQAG